MPSSKSSDSSSVKNAVIIVLVGLCIWGYYRCPQTEPSRGAFSQEITDSVHPITQKLASSPEKRAALAAFYLAWADAIHRDQGRRIKSTALFRTAHSFSLDVYLQETGMQGDPTVGKEIDAAIIAAIGNKVKPIDAQLSEQLEEILLAIAWACDAKVPE